MYIIIHQIFKNIDSVCSFITRIITLFAFFISGYTIDSPSETVKVGMVKNIDTAFNQKVDSYVSSTFGSKRTTENADLACFGCSPQIVRSFISNTARMRDSKENRTPPNEEGAFYNNTFHSNDTNGANYETLY